MRSHRSLSAVARFVRRHDHDRFLTALFAPRARRESLFALYAFNYEVAKTAEVVSEPILGQIRLQWWRERLDDIFAGAPPASHEVLEPLAAAIRAHKLTRAHFDRVVAAREWDLAGEPPPSLAALEAYAEDSSARLVWLALEVLNERSEEAGEAGRSVGLAYALGGLLRAIPFHARSRRLFLPRDLCAAEGLDPERDVFALRPSPALRRVAEQVAAAAAQHLAAARLLRPRLPAAALPALLPATLAAADLARLKRARYDPFEPRYAVPDPWRSWRLSLAAFGGRY